MNECVCVCVYVIVLSSHIHTSSSKKKKREDGRDKRQTPEVVRHIVSGRFSEMVMGEGEGTRDYVRF